MGIAVLFVVGGAAALRVDIADAQSCRANAITAENCLPGSPAGEWDIVGSGDPSIQGFATDISVNRGQRISFKIATDAASYRLDIYRLGYYQGMGARKIATVLPSAQLPQNQPACLTSASTGLIDCGTWGVSASWSVPTNATSGIYVAKVTRENGGASHIVFVVRDDSSTSDLLFKTSDTTWQAYNDYGGNSLYVGAPAGRAYAVSYNRPFATRGNQFGRAWLFGAEYPMVRWLEANGYDVSYFTSVDGDRYGSLIVKHKAFLSVGHDEYWSGAERANVEAARNAGVHLAFFTGNGMFWKARWESSVDGARTPYRTLVSYKETHAGAKIDPESTWTGAWRDPRFSPPADGGRPENAVTGTIFAVNCCGSNGIEVPAADGKLRLWRNTSVAALAPGQVATLAAGTLGYEWDEDLDNGFRPAGLFRLSLTTLENVVYLQDYGSSYAPGTATHSLTLYRHSSGALVFGAGTIRWSWGLDVNHDPDPATPNAASTPDVRMRQATVNLLADMGVQPWSLQTGLSQASPSTDSMRPTTTINAPTGDKSVEVGRPATVAGTAVDLGAGNVAGVEVSTDAGATWHPASGREVWSYRWTPPTLGPVSVMARAVDDSGNLEDPGARRSILVAEQACPCGVWTSSLPSVAASSDSAAVELGVKFRSAVDGFVTSIRFYKGPGNTGQHVGSLWTASGALLGRALFTNETATGWQQVDFPTAVPIKANTVYVASYHAPNGHYAFDHGYFASSGFGNETLHLLGNGESGGNGVYAYGTTITFPTSTNDATNYWVDVVFKPGSAPGDEAPPFVTSSSPADGELNVANGTTVTVSFNKPMDSASINASTFELRDASDRLVPAAIAFDAARITATLTPTEALADSTRYRATLRGGEAIPRVQDLAGNAIPATVAWSFTTAGTDYCLCVWDSSVVPANPADGTDSRPIELGVKFRATVNGLVTGIRFYKGPGNTGEHIGNLWTDSGALLASAAFTNETDMGWQRVDFARPVPVTANAVYVASYHAPNGHYAVDTGYFARGGFGNGSLYFLGNGESGGNGVYAQGTTSTFPTATDNAKNYWVDVVFTEGSEPISPELPVTPPAPPTGRETSAGDGETPAGPTTQRSGGGGGAFDWLALGALLVITVRRRVCA
jgi:hypothetical protein